MIWLIIIVVIIIIIINTIIIVIRFISDSMTIHLDVL